MRSRNAARCAPVVWRYDAKAALGQLHRRVHGLEVRGVKSRFERRAVERADGAEGVTAAGRELIADKVFAV